MTSKMRVLLFLFAVIPILTLGAALKVFASDVPFSEYVIRSDGSIDPVTPLLVSADNITYAITSNMTGSIRVERWNVVVDGFGYTLRGLMGVSNETAFTLNGVSNVTVRNAVMEDFYRGFELNSSVGVTVSNNTISHSSEVAMACSLSSNLTISGNILANNVGEGIRIESSTDSTVLQNTVTNNTSFGIWIRNSSRSLIRRNIVMNNLWRGVLLDSSSNNTIAENYLEGSEFGIFLNNSTRNDVLGNTLVSNPYVGIYIHAYSRENRIVNNTLTENDYYGVWLFYSSDNTLTGNNVTKSTFGIDMQTSDNCISAGNTLTDNLRGIRVEDSSHSLVVGNSIANNNVGIELVEASSNNAFYHNNLIDNSQQVYVGGLLRGYANVWDEGYPSGGNYWSDYNGTDYNHDGIGDTPYILNAESQDNYPLMSPYEFLGNLITGDVNGDMRVDMRDIGVLCSKFGATPSSPDWNPNYDLNGDNVVNENDLCIALSKFGKHF